MGAADSKICIRCSADCSSGERYRDAQGKYICGTCERALRATAPDVNDDGTIPLADEIGGGSGGDSDGKPNPPPSRLCSNCGLLLGANIICIGCGLNSSTGRMMGESELHSPGEGKTCRACGYSLAGLGARRCPECGTYNGRRSRREHDHENSSYVRRLEYLIPAIMFSVGILITILAHLASGESAEHVGILLLSYTVAIPAGVAAFFILCLVGLGFDAPHHLTALRLAAIFAATDALDVVLGHTCAFLPLPILFGPWFIVLIVYIGLLMEMLDLELQDAVLVGLVTYAIRIGAFTGLLYVLGYSVF